MGTSVSAPNEFSPITPASLAPAKPLTIAPATVEPVVSVASLPPVEPAVAPVNPISDTESLIAQLEGRNVDREANVQTAEQTRELNEINKQIALHQARSLASEEEALTRTGGTTDFASLEARKVGRINAVKAMELNALAQAKQGNLQLARTLAEDSITEKYKQVETDLRKKINDIKNNYDSFTAVEKKQADALLTRYNAEDAFVKEKKDNEKALQTIGSTAAANGAPLSLVQQAMATGDTVKANAMLAKYAKNPTEQRRDALELRKLEAEVSKIEAETEQKISEGKPVTVVNDPTKTTSENNLATLRGIFKSSKVSAGNKTSIGNGLALAQAAQDLADANVDGAFTGLSPFRAVTDIRVPFTDINLIPFRKAGKRSETIKNESLISALDLQTQFWASGAALSEEQTKLVQKMIPVPTDTDRQIRTKVNQLMNYMLSQTASRLVTDGIDYKPEKVNMFEMMELLEKATPEQRKELGL